MVVWLGLYDGLIVFQISYVFNLQDGKGRSHILVKAMDEYGLGVAATFNASTKSKFVQAKNLMMRIDRIPGGIPV